MPDEIINEGQEKVKEVQEAIPTSEIPADSSIETDGQLPEGVSERTRQQFEKLKEHNRQLAEQLKEKTQPKSSALDSLMPTAPIEVQGFEQKEVEEVMKDIVDADGYVDTALLKSKLEESRNVAKQATVFAQQAINEAKQAKAAIDNMSKEQVVAKTHASFPEVDPNSDKFNPVLYDLVRNELIGQMMQGKQDFYSATEKWINTLKAQQPKVDTEASSREHINTGGQSRPDQSIDHARLVQGTLNGDALSIGERLKLSGY